MRYLYGDSVPFPPQYDLLGAVKTFVEHAATAARLDAEDRLALEAIDADAVAKTRAAESLESAHVAVMYALGTATTGGQPLIADYARRVQDFAAAIVVAVRQDAGGDVQRAREAARAKAAQGRAVIRQSLEAILVAMRLPVSESRIVMELDGQTNEFESAFVHSGGIATSFALAVDMLPDWQKPRRIADFAQGVALPVGLKRSLFKRTVTHEPVTLDDYTIGGFDLEDGRLELKLRRRADQPDVLVFKLSETDAGYTALVEHPGESGAEALEPSLDAGSVKELERFITLLRSACGAVVAHKSHLLGVTLNGQDVFDDGLVPALLAVIVKVLAPTVAEISRRSTSPLELTLKTEDDEGRRQEIYLKKADLFAKLDAVPPASRAIFEPLRAALEARPETPPPPDAR